MSDVKKLREARRLVEEFLHTLNTSGQTCPNCQSLIREDFDEFKAFQELEGVSNKLKKWADQMEDKR